VALLFFLRGARLFAEQPQFAGVSLGKTQLFFLVQRVQIEPHLFVGGRDFDSCPVSIRKLSSQSLHKSFCVFHTFHGGAANMCDDVSLFKCSRRRYVCVLVEMTQNHNSFSPIGVRLA
jgi:hypothetical protein